MGLGTAEETNQRLRYLLAEGQTSISLTGLGYAPFESSDPRSNVVVTSTASVSVSRSS